MLRILKAGNCSSPYRVFPNPADQYIAVSETSEDGSVAKTHQANQPQSTIIALKLFDDKSNLIKSRIFKSPTTSIDTKDLPQGHYILYVVKTSGIDKRHIVIKKD